MSDQMIFKRYEIKYMLTKQQKIRLCQMMQSVMVADEHGRSTIQSLYFDTPDYRLIRTSLDKPFYKEKLRLRSYGVATKNSPVFIELKKKYDSVVYKRRIGMTEQQACAYLLSHEPVHESQISHEIDYCMNYYRDLAPRMLLSYEREAFYHRTDRNLRITFDENILWRNYDVDLKAGIYGSPILKKDQVLMEVKTAGAMPLWLVNFLSENRIYKTSFSKYGTAYRTLMQRTGEPETAFAGETASIYEKGGIYHYA